MDHRVLDVWRKIILREPTDKDRAMTANLLENLPRELLGSPAALADIVLRANMLAQMDEKIDRISFEAQQTLHRDLPLRIDKAALTAFNKMRDYLPVDANDSLRRVLRAATLLSALVFTIGASAGWIVHRYAEARHQEGKQAITDEQFERCISAAEGSAMSQKPGVGALRYDSAIYRGQARQCAAEYADRRAGS